MDKDKTVITTKLLEQISSLPAEIQEQDAPRIKSTLECLDPSAISTINPEQLVKVLVCSDFVCKWARRKPEDFVALIADPSLDKDLDTAQLWQQLEKQAGAITSQDALGTLLRQFRQKTLVRIAWRDICGSAQLQQTMGELSALADCSIRFAYEKLFSLLCNEYGRPVNAQGEPQSMIVIAMGKLGGKELNFSSDVDLMFVFPDDGETTGGNRTLSNSEFFIRLGQQLISLLDKNTADGFVFRVDMRLRPFGKSGALALSFDAMENYYQTHGREWERYAMIKARFLTGDEQHKQQLKQILKPFVYRRYLDFNVYDSLRSMKQLIVQEVKRKDMDNNIKLGAGGIREIEFIGQTFQLIRGGRSPQLQNPYLLPTLEHLGESGLLPDYTCKQLAQAYTFLRNTEHRIQEFDDQQTHNIPDDPAAQARLAYAMNFSDRETFFAELEHHRQHVRNHFDQVFVAPQKDADSSGDNELSSIWDNTSSTEQAMEILANAGYQSPQASFKTIKELNKSNRYKALGKNGRTLLNQLMPLLLSAIGQQKNPDATLPRIIKLIECITQRTTYMALLLENPMALSQLVRLVAASPWIADQISKHPILLDELLDPRSLYAPPGRAVLENDLQNQLQCVDSTDLESQMEILRLFKQVNVLRVAAADIVDALPLMKVSDHLTWIAEVILKQVLSIAWNDLVNKHGAPQCEINNTVTEPGFAIIAYGKLGGIELGYGSDLDLVFLHCAASESGMTEGDKPVANPVFFARLGQRIIHIINTLTPSGVLYEVDMRLRPSGASGMLVSHINAYADYQCKKAWTWEHQALVRARFVAGDEHVARAFEQLRAETLSQARDHNKLKTDVSEMREKMRKSNDKSDNESVEKESAKFDLKQGRGGIADIEFMVQYGVLAWSADHPELLEFSDNIRLLEGFGKIGCLPQEDATNIMDAYRHYRNLVHRLTLSGESALVDSAQVVNFREQIIRIWDKLLGCE